MMKLITFFLIITSSQVFSKDIVNCFSIDNTIYHVDLKEKSVLVRYFHDHSLKKYKNVKFEYSRKRSIKSLKFGLKNYFVAMVTFNKKGEGFGEVKDQDLPKGSEDIICVLDDSISGGKPRERQ